MPRAALDEPAPARPAAGLGVRIGDVRATFTRRPNAPSSAGSRVSDPTIVSATASAAAIAGPFRSPMPSVSMPSSATTTVVPANSTERPAVSIAVSVDSRTSAPESALGRGSG